MEAEGGSVWQGLPTLLGHGVTFCAPAELEQAPVLPGPPEWCLPGCLWVSHILCFSFLIYDLTVLRSGQ